jgi:hypothetical protein
MRERPYIPDIGLAGRLGLALLVGCGIVASLGWLMPV